jgi:hypothetical protein
MNVDLSNIGYEANAQLMKFDMGRHTYHLLIPNNISDYQYLSHFPLSAFLFVTLFSQQDLEELSVSDIMQGYLGYDYYEDVLSFSRIKGFEDIATDIGNLDEFGIAARKQEIISRLLDCYKNYCTDYRKYLMGVGGFYIFRNPTQEKVMYASPDYNNVGIYNKVSIVPPASFVYEIARHRYNFDSNVLSIGTLAGVSNRPFESWEFGYDQAFFRKHNNPNDNKPNVYFPETLSIPVSIDDAKKLFDGEQRTFCETRILVKALYGLSYQQDYSTYRTSNFDIYKIVKIFYRDETDLNTPVLILEAESTSTCQLR